MSPVWLIDLTIDGRLERFATRAVHVPTESGDFEPYREGLSEISLDLAADLAGGVVSTAVEISSDWLEGFAVDQAGWSQLVAAWHQIEGSPAVLRRWNGVTTLERARVMLRGFAEEVEHGGTAEPLTFTLRRNLFVATHPMLIPSHRVDATTWPVTTGAGIERDPKSEGAYYPRLFGFPGDDSVSAYVPGIPRAASPAVICETRGNTGSGNFLAVADGVIDAVGRNVRIYDYSTDPPDFDDFIVEVENDLLGQPVSGIKIVNPTNLQPDFGHAFYAGLATSSFFGGGGELLPDGSGPIRGLGDLIRHLLKGHTRADVFEIDPRLNAWRVDTWLNDASYDAWPWITDMLLPMAPFRLFEGRLGLAIRLMDWTAKPTDAVTRFDATLKDVERASGVRSRPASGVRNRITIEWKKDRATGKYLEHYTLDASASPTDSRAAASLRAAMSQRRFARLEENDDGVRELLIQSPHTWDPATVPLIARWKMAELALPHTDIVYRSTDPNVVDRVDPTDPVIIHDPEVGLIERIALVSRITPRPSDTLLSLVVLDDPTTVARLT